MFDSSKLLRLARLDRTSTKMSETTAVPQTVVTEPVENTPAEQPAATTEATQETTPEAAPEAASEAPAAAAAAPDAAAPDASAAPAPAETTPEATQRAVEETTTPPAPVPAFLGDDLISDAEVVYDQRRTIKGSPEDAWPWIVQWGKGRGGWYVPSKFEKVLPEKFRSAPTINPEWQTLSVGDRVPDYNLGGSKKQKKGTTTTKGGDKDKKEKTGKTTDHLEVALVENQRALVYKGKRMGLDFTWALLLETPSGAPVNDANTNTNSSSAQSTGSASETVLHLRFRGKPEKAGWKGKVAMQVRKVTDNVMASAMFPGIIDRIEQQEKKAKVAS